jgi:F-type H+-transporting ATPase subunit delta
MSELTVASRYAKSLIDLSEEQGSVEAIRADMELFLKTLRASPQLKAVLANPIISHKKKIKILDEVFLNKVDSVSIAFFKLMISKGRGEVLYHTAHEFINQYDVIENIVKASVVSASVLSEENKNTIIAEIKEVTGGTVLLNAKVDPALIGGFILTVGDRQVDTSISGDLKKIRREFAQRVVSN